MRVAELAEYHDGGRFWKEHGVHDGRGRILRIWQAQRDAGLRQQPPGLVLLQNLMAHLAGGRGLCGDRER